MDEIIREQIIEHVRNSMELNVGAGILASIKDAADFHDVELSDNEMNELGFSIVFGKDSEKNPLF